MSDSTKNNEYWIVGPISTMTTTGIRLQNDYSKEAKILSDIIEQQRYDELQGVPP